jgi:hypothetical protein
MANNFVATIAAAFPHAEADALRGGAGRDKGLDGGMSDGASLVQELRRQIAELQLDNTRLWRESQELRGTAAPLGNDPETEINDKERLWRETHPSPPLRLKKIRPERAPREKGPINISDDLWMPEPNSGCWLWLGKTHDGRAWFRNLAAARVMWRMLHGTPRGHVWHTCANLLCVNPGHLYLR